MKLKMWQAITLVVALVGSGAGAYTWRHSVKTSQVASLPANTQLATVQLGNVVNAVTASGTLSFTSSSDLTFGSAGTVLKVNVGVGDAVKKGQSVASIDTADLLRAVTQASINLKTAQTNLTNAQTPYTADDLNKAKATVALATANLNKALQSLTDGQAPDPL
ncbi:MAG: biotin/lipoyl-binding protein, partial [Dehalococcoidia bacterium]|nr:biotin/lipoyl-binding protein [Dehalococcoidia bacterium]